MPSLNYGLSTRSLAELALVVSRTAPSIIDLCAAPSAAILRQYWQSNRSLQQRWMKTLDRWRHAGTLELDVLEELAPRVFTCDMAVRTFSTIMAAIDRRRGGDDLTRLALNAVKGLGQVRNEVLSSLLLVPGPTSNRVLELDRLRRQSDRWTDLLLGPVAVQCGFFEFAFDEERARDFGEEAALASSTSGPNVTEHLASAGLRLKFIQRLSAQPIEEPELIDLMQSMLSVIPSQAFQREGTIRTQLERRVVAGRQRLECLVTSPLRFVDRDAKAINDLGMGN